MFEASSVCFQYVNERAAHVKIDRVSPFPTMFSKSLPPQPGLCVKEFRVQALYSLFAVVQVEIYRICHGLTVEIKFY